MSENPINPTIPPVVPSTVPISAASLPADPSAGGGSGATPPTGPSPSTNIPASPQPIEVTPDHQIEFAGVRMSIREAVEAKKQLDTIGASGYSDFQAAMKGDRSAAMRLMQKFQEPAPSSTTPVQAPAASPVASSAAPPRWDEVLKFVDTLQAEKVTQNLDTLIKSKPEYAALAKRPGAVAEVIQDLNVLASGGQKISPQIVDNLLRLRSAREAEYQKTLVAPYEQRLGDLGLEDPFRGGAAQVLSETKIDPKADWAGYKKQLNRRFQAALGTSRTANGLNSPNVV